MNISIIKNDKELKKAIHELTALMEKYPEPKGAIADKMELMAIVVSDYENKHFPIPKSDPRDVIKFRMEQMGLTVKDLTPCIGKSNRVYEVLNGKRNLTLSMIRKLCKTLKLPADSLIGVEA